MQKGIVAVEYTCRWVQPQSGIHVEGYSCSRVYVQKGIAAVGYTYRSVQLLQGIHAEVYSCIRVYVQKGIHAEAYTCRNSVDCYHPRYSEIPQSGHSLNIKHYQHNVSQGDVGDTKHRQNTPPGNQPLSVTSFKGETLGVNSQLIRSKRLCAFEMLMGASFQLHSRLYIVHFLFFFFHLENTVIK